MCVQRTVLNLQLCVFVFLYIFIYRIHIREFTIKVYIMIYSSPVFGGASEVNVFINAWTRGVNSSSWMYVVGVTWTCMDSRSHFVYRCPDDANCVNSW